MSNIVRGCSSRGGDLTSVGAAPVTYARRRHSSEVTYDPTWRNSVRTFPGAPQLTACFTSALIHASTSAVTSVRAKPAAHIVPSSRFAWSLNPSVA